MNGNQGISFGDNVSISGSALAAGEGATAQNHVRYAAEEQDELAAQVERMIALLDQEVAQGRLSPEAADTGREVQRQLSSESPNKFLIRTLLEGLSTGAASLTGVVEAVSAVQGLFAKLL